ncbi:MAG: hypothetical protein R3F33_10070 [Planctomycetota bacterium]
MLKPRGSEGLWGAVWQPVVAAGFLLLGVVGAGLAAQRKRWLALWLCAATLAIPLGLWALATLGYRNTYIERSTLASLPFLCILWALPLARLRSLGAAMTLLCTGLLVLFYLRSDHWTVYKPHPDWRGMQAQLAPYVPQEGAQLLYSDYPSPTPLAYYDPRFQESKTFVFNAAKWQRASERLAGLPVLGPWLGQRVAGWAADWQEQARDAAAGMRVDMRELAATPEGVERAATGEVWLLVYGEPGARAAAWIADSAWQHLEVHRTQGLIVYRLQRSE